MPAKKTNPGAEKLVIQRVKKMPAVGPASRLPRIHSDMIDSHEHHHDAAHDVQRRQTDARGRWWFVHHCVG